MLVPPPCLGAGPLHWLSVVIFCLSFMGACCLPTETPIIFSYDDTTPFPNAVKCFTCDNKKSNEECNSRAYDAFCPKGTKYCYTAHHLNHESGDSVFVTKLCATNGECTPSSVGCSDTHRQDIKRCVSCCEGSKCNMEAPSNSSTAIFTTITPYSHGTILRSSRRFTALCLILTTILVRGWLW